MAEFNQVLWALDNEIQPRSFERLCVDLLGREGYHHIVPIGGSKDHGRDAEFRCWRGAADGHSVVAFQFSLQDTWEKKLREDADKIATHCPDVVAMVFVTSQDVTGAKQDLLREEFKLQRGWHFTVYSREWLRHRLAEFHQDLAKKYLSLDLPPTVVGYGATLADLSDLDEESFKEAFRQTSPELVRASILESTRKEPAEVGNWYRLARIEFLLRNYSGALAAVTKALQLKPRDLVAVINMTNFKGAVLAELGMQDHSRPLMIEARNIFQNAVEKLKRASDHFNLANVLGALGETDGAGKHYLRCVELKPDYAEAWKNFGSLFIQKGKYEWGMECFDKALHYKPNLVEAHLSKATAFLLFFERADEAIRCFEVAYKILPDLDRKWKYVRYWFSVALLVAGQNEEALMQIEAELVLRPADAHLLNQKASVLSKLRKKDKAWEEQAVQFFEFRAHAIPNDYLGLAELIEIFTERGCPERAWPSIETNLVCKPFSLRDVAGRAGISLSDFQAGFQNARLYRTFRKKFSLEDHCVTLHSYGLDPSASMLAAFDSALIARFGVVAREIREATEKKVTPDIHRLFKATLNTIARLFPLFGVNWLAKAKPQESDEQVKLLSIGIFYLMDVVVAETARIVAFAAGYYGVPDEIVREGQKENWKEIGTEIGVSLMEQVLKDWEMVKPK